MKNKLAAFTLSLLVFQGGSYDAFSSEQSHLNAAFVGAVEDTGRNIHNLPREVLIEIISQVDVRETSKLLSTFKEAYRRLCNVRICFGNFKLSMLNFMEGVELIFNMDQQPAGTTLQKYSDARVKAIAYLYDYNNERNLLDASAKRSYARKLDVAYQNASDPIKREFTKKHGGLKALLTVQDATKQATGIFKK